MQGSRAASSRAPRVGMQAASAAGASLLPTFLIIGAAKCGTTSLYHYCAQHPDIFMSPNKSPRFFVYEGQDLDPSHPVHRSTITRLEDYQALFAGSNGERARGEASTAYIAHPEAIERMKRYVPEVKVIAMVRNPVDRTHSHFLHAIKSGLEPGHVTFEDALWGERRGVKIGSHVRDRPYIRMSFFHRMLEPYREAFGADRLRILFFDDLVKDPVAFAQRVYGFLGVDAAFVPATETVYQKTGVPRNKALHAVLRSGAEGPAAWLKPLIPKRLRAPLRNGVMNRNLHKPPMSPGTRDRLIDMFRDDVHRLQDMVGRDLSSWLEVPAVDPGRAVDAIQEVPDGPAAPEPA